MAKGIYVGVNSPIPIYETTPGEQTTEKLSGTNISPYFSYIEYENSRFLETQTPKNGDVCFLSIVNNSTGGAQFVAVYDITNVNIYCQYSVDSTGEIFLSVAGSTILDTSGSNSSREKVWSGNLKEGEIIDWQFTTASYTNRTCYLEISCDQKPPETITGYENKDVARKVKKAYLGIDGIAKRIKKAYIGIGGVARPCFSLSEIVYHGATEDPLSTARYRLAATTVGTYALFGGGADVDGLQLSSVDAYNVSLTHSNPSSSLSVARYNLAATTVDNKALFGGGWVDGSYSSRLDAYNTSLSRQATALSVARENLAATTVGNCALFGGGSNDNGLLTTVDAYTASLTNKTASLSVARQSLAATSVGDYALFGGGAGGGFVVDAYDASLNHKIPMNFSVGRQSLAATSVGDYALFGGGYYGDPDTRIDAYDTSLTRTTPIHLSAARRDLAATTVGNYALFSGGYYPIFGGDRAYDPMDTIDIYNASLTLEDTSWLSIPRGHLAATTVGNYALFGGGHTIGLAFNVVDVYTIIEN